MQEPLRASRWQNFDDELDVRIISDISDVEDWLNGGVILPSEEMLQEDQNLEAQ